uniref:FAT atypical cadherin 2 n=1 Tax=Nothobranchius furzeri TaxID=105023 RepID=A0A8C6K5V0_NOTFU
MEVLKMTISGAALLLLVTFLLHVAWCHKSMGKEKYESSLSFTHYLYNVTINENSAPRMYVETPVKMGIQLTDPLWDISYNIVAGDDEEFFQAEALSVGDFCFLRIKTRSSNSALLNREVRDRYTLTLEAKESTFDLQAKTKVIVQVLDTNDLKPLFYPASYNVNIGEDTPLKSSVVTVSATDADIGSNAEFYYSFTSRAHPFAVDPFTGTVSLVKKLNHTTTQKYDLTILAEDRTKKISGVQKFGNSARVVVNIQKMSKESPVITPPPKPVVSTDGNIDINVHVEEGIKPVESLDIIAGDSHNNFEIIPLGVQGKDFQVISTKRIVWSENPFGLNLSLQAKDRFNSVSPVAQVHIPANLYTPLVFLEDTYIVTLSEFSPPKSHVVKVSVTSFYHDVTFSIKNNPDSSSFKINPKSGIIITTEKFDYERKDRYEFDVVANHGDAETHVVVEITDENDNSPQFKQTSYRATVDENTPVGSSVLKVFAFDIDKGKNGYVTYAIANPDLVPFIIDPFTGVISTSEHLDYEMMLRLYHLKVWASDSGSPFSQVSECPVTINLNNLNDNVPLFERVDCNITIPPDLHVGHTIVELSATDLDELQQLKYVIESGNELQVFVVDAGTGAIALKQPIPPQEGSFTLRVVATDGKHHSEASVVRITVTNKGDDATLSCFEMGISQKQTDKLIESMKSALINQEEESFSDVHITNRHSPKFVTSIPSSIDVAENHPLHSTILQFKATDLDSGFNGELVFAISSGNEDGCFSIDIFSGNLYLVCPLDRESKEFYILNITVYDLGTPQTSAWKFIAVSVIDVNDNPPVFDQPRYVIRMPENKNKDSVIFTARAVDLDSEVNGNIQYSLLTSSDMFKIDELTGEVIVTGHLDREASPKCDLWIKARDQPKLGPQLFSTIRLVVVLLDINDNPPKFEPKGYHIKVPEDVPVGALLVWVESIDLDSGSGGLVTYNLQNTEGGIFHLDSSTGALTLERELDFERRPTYNLTIRAVDHGLPRSLSSSCYVEIEVLDVNENLHKPVFTEFVYETGVMEDAAVGTSVVMLTASDKDLGRDGVVRYHISDGSGVGVFSIDEETGVVRTTEGLDREKVQHYWLSVYATDLGTEPLISWTHVFVEVLDVNDNPPELSQPVYFASVPENVKKVNSIVQVLASDKDTSSEDKLSFQMQEIHKTFFDVDPKTGVISTLSALDREDKAEHSIEVIVSDNGSPALQSTATVVVKVLDANDNAPRFTGRLFQVKLLEQQHHAGRKLVCRLVARDDDEGTNAAVTYRLQDNRDDQFQIDPLTGVVTSLGDFWAGNYSILMISATDQGDPSLSSTTRLDIEWVQQPPPSSKPIRFEDTHFSAAIMEIEHVHHLVGILETDEPWKLQWFSIIGGDEDKDFDIQRNSATLTTARRLNATRHSNYNLTVEVTDGHSSSTTQVYIRVLDMNEHRPFFLKSLYEVRVPEDTSPWKDILQISAQDADSNSKLVFSIHSSLPPDSTKLFHLDPKSGVLVIKEELDFEMISVHTLIIMVRDQEIPVMKNFAKVQIQVEDCNDHSPAFLSPRYKASISNMAPAGSQVIRVKALDKDMGSNADIIYSLHSGNIDSMFSIDPELGSISVAKSLSLQPQDQFQLTVKATDQGFPQRSDLCSIHIHIHVSDQTPPTFPSEEYLREVNESSSPGTPVVTISASSAAPMHYGIESGNINGTFYINPYTGLISTQKHLDFEICESYKLKVTASTPSGALSKTLVYIYVIDENDNAPVFQQTEYLGQISESAHVNSMVMGKRNTPLVIQASDADRDFNSLLVYQILEPEALKVFKIDPNMGTISLISPLDFETKAEYHLTVQVKDSGKPSLYASEPAKITVHVLDLNDCPPQFITSVYKPSITFPAIRDAEVVRVTAHDADSAVSYSITEGNLHHAFSIHPDTGVITVSNVSDFRPFYKLTIRASDGLFRDVATVEINVTNLVPSDLRFEQKVYTTSVQENLNFVKPLASLKVSGCFLNEPLLYSVLNPMGKFAISQTSGVLETTGIPFDREEQDLYDLVVKVEDMRAPPRTATAQVKVFIDDVNDNPPQFLNLPFSMMISEDTEPGDVLYQATAIDIDLEENEFIMYSLDDDYGLFRIDPDVGDISLQRPLDFEALNKYELIVLATDDGEPSLSTMAQLIIQVRNRTNPIFQTLLYPLKVPENVPPFTTILHVQARNPEGYRLIYNLEEENASKHFHIDFKTGVLTVTNPLDYESQTMHVLTVRATDSVTGAFSEASIEIEVEDVNDNAPVFSQPAYSVNIAEGLPANTSVIQLSATDKDSGRNKDLTFQIVQSEDSNVDFFEVNPKTGLIVTKRVLDREDLKHFNLKVKVIDNGTVSLSTEAMVLVNVTDVNDNPPDFGSPSYKATLDETAKCGHIVVKIQASDPDSDDLDNLKYKIISGNEDRYFNINESSGIISFSNVCKRNLDPYYNLTVAVSDGVFQKTAPVDIAMINSNRHSPYFKQSIYEAELAENAEAGTRVIRLAAIDPDDGPYGSVDYTIINKLADEKFAIHKDGQIVTTQPLDRESPNQRVIAIKVMAKDGGGKVAFCTVKIILTDENDNVPQFEAKEYQVSIQSTINKGSPVIKIMAYDADDGKNADVTYSVDEAEEVIEDIIEINPFTGFVTVKESLVGMENKIFNFKVKARDGSLPFYNSTVPVQLKVVSPEVPLPKFSEPLYSFSAAEDYPIGTEIGSVRADSDMPLIYSLVNGNIAESNKDNEFILDKETGTLVLQKPIDHEKTKRYQIDVVAQGNHNGTEVASLVSVVVQVRDVNDNQPMFDASPYRAFLAENMPAGTTVIQVTPKKCFTLLISCSLNSSNRVSKTFNTIQKYFTNLSVIFGSIKFDCLNHQVTANDPDAEANGQVTYSLESMPDNSLVDFTEVFSIDEDSGWITTLRETDCEANRFYRFNVVATDHGGDVKLSSSVLVEVMVTDENDNPVFLYPEYTAQLPESFAVGSKVLSVSALTRDGGGPDPIVYRIISGNEDKRFLLDSRTGLLTLVAPLDFEVSREYYLSVEGSRGKSSLSDITTIIVNVTDVNDNTPVFGQGVYSAEITEDLTPGSLVTATDQDGPVNSRLRYSIVSGDVQQQFSIHPRNGEITIRTSLDREEIPHYSLTVQAADEGNPPLSSAVLVTITITDVNDNPPIFSRVSHSLVLQEGESIGSSFLQLVVVDRDTPKNGPPFSFHIVSGNEDHRFHVDQGGLLSLSAPLRKKTKPFHQLKIQVTDSGHPPLSSICVVNINVTEQSKYPPSVVPLEVFITTAGEMFSNRVIGRLHATDQDVQDILTYTLVSENPDGKRFSVESTDGKIWADEHLEEGSYTLNVSVSDGKFSVWAGVKVHVWEANQKALDSGLTLQLDRMSPEEFLGDHWRGLQRLMANELGLTKQELHLASLQQIPDTQVLEALLIWRPKGQSVQALPTNRLAGELSKPIHKSCNHGEVNYLTFAYRSQMTAQGHSSSDSIVAVEQTVKLMNFYFSVQLTKGELHFVYRCGNIPPNRLLFRADPVSDGHWHSVLLEVNTTVLKLILDHHHPASISLTEPCRMMKSHGALQFAPLSASSIQDFGLETHHFFGCLEGLKLNGKPIIGGSAEWTGSGSRTVFGMVQCCNKSGGCNSLRCENGGVCTEDEAGEFLFCTNRYFQPTLAKSLKPDCQEGKSIEMNLVSSTNNLDHTPFRSLRPRSQIGSSSAGSLKTHGPVVCSVAPNLPARPPSSSDNDSIRKARWDMDYEGVCEFDTNNNKLFKTAIVTDMAAKVKSQRTKRLAGNCNNLRLFLWTEALIEHQNPNTVTKTIRSTC